jgi:hypothetical protein
LRLNVLVSLTLLLGLAGGLRAAEAPPLYQADFEVTTPGPLPADWSGLTGAWGTATDDSTVLTQTLPSFRGLGEAARGWSDYDVTAIIRPLGGAGQWGVGLIGYHRPNGDCYRLSSYGGLLVLWRQAADGPHALAAVRQELKLNLPYRFRLSLRNEKTQTLLRGKVWDATAAEPEKWALEAQDVGDPLRQGRPGLFTGRATAAFTDLQVLGAANQVLFQDALAGADTNAFWQLQGGDWRAPEAAQPLRQLQAGSDPAFQAGTSALLSGWRNYTVQINARAAAGSRNQGFGVSGYLQGEGWGYQLGQLNGSSLVLARRTAEGQAPLATVPFTVTRGVWYVLKLRLQNLPTGVQLQGKIWPARAGEPAQWQIQAEDRRQPGWRGGEVGVWGLDDVCSFDDLLVKGNP